MFPRLIVPWTNARGPAYTESYAAKNSAATHARAPRQAGTWSAHFLSTPGCIFGSLSMGCCAGAILDSYKPVHYGPPDFGGGYCRDLAKTDAGVESMADDAREKGDREQPLDNEAALSTRLKRLGEQLGQVHPDRRSEAVRINVKPRIPRRSRGAFGSRPNSSPASWSARRSVGLWIAGSE